MARDATRDVDTGALRCFVSAVRTGSMGRAAEALGGTQPEVRQEIRRREASLGCTLLRRTSSGVVVTGEGESFLPLAERILALNDEAGPCEESRGGRRRTTAHRIDRGSGDERPADGAGGFRQRPPGARARRDGC